MARKMGKQSYKFSNKISLKDTRVTVGPIEGKGPLVSYFDEIVTDDMFGMESYEKAEHQMCLKNINSLLYKNSLDYTQMDLYIGGDLLNQLITTNLTARDIKIPYYGVYNACATFAQALQIGAMSIEGGFNENVLISATSHFSTAERQYRYPLELGTQSPPTSQRTVTGTGAVILNKNEEGVPVLRSMTIGRVMDFEQNDPNDMGSAMAIAACDTILTHLEDMDISGDEYDLIVTGDLGKIGYNVALDFLKTKKVDLSYNLKDCGMMIYDMKNQEIQNGGSGAGCSASVFCSYLYDKLKKKELNKILLVATGALLSPISTGQNENIPCIAHAVAIWNQF